MNPHVYTRIEFFHLYFHGYSEGIKGLVAVGIKVATR